MDTPTPTDTSSKPNAKTNGRKRKSNSTVTSTAKKSRVISKLERESWNEEKATMLKKIDELIAANTDVNELKRLNRDLRKDNSILQDQVHEAESMSKENILMKSKIEVQDLEIEETWKKVKEVGKRNTVNKLLRSAAYHQVIEQKQALRASVQGRDELATRLELTEKLNKDLQRKYNDLTGRNSVQNARLKSLLTLLVSGCDGVTNPTSTEFLEERSNDYWRWMYCKEKDKNFTLQSESKTKNQQIWDLQRTEDSLKRDVKLMAQKVAFDEDLRNSICLAERDRGRRN